MVEGEPAEHRRLSDALDALAASVTEDRVDLASIDRFLGRRSIGAMLLVLALPMALPVPVPGISALFGIPLILISAQLLLGRRTAWLPVRISRRSIARADFVALIGRVLPKLRTVERLVRPRLGWMTGNLAMVPVGAVCLLLSIIIALPMPFGNVVPGIAVALVALGVIERDGLVIGLGLFVAVIAFAVVALASAGLVAVLRSWFSL